MALASLAAAAGALSAGAQMHKVEAPEKTTRAIAVYEWTGELGKPSAARLVPVSLFIDGHFEDAGAYLARPVPWVLSTGVEFFIEHAGTREGTLDLEYARNLRRATLDDNPLGAWYGYGRFKLPSAAPPPKALKPARVLPIIEGSDDDSRPHLAHRTPPAVGSSPASTPASTPDSKDKTASTSSGSTPAADPDRPTLGHRTPAASDPTTTTASSSPEEYDPDRPTLQHRDDDNGKKPKRAKPQASVSGPAQSLNDDPDRPTLRRGKAQGEADAAALNGLPAQMHQAVAVSDPATHPEHVFTRAWDSESERKDTLAALETLARARATAYLAANKLTAGVAPPATPAIPASGAAGTAAKPAAATDAGTDLNYRPVLRTKASADAAKAAEAAAAKSNPPAAKPASAQSATPTKPTAAKTTSAKPGTRSTRARAATAKPPGLALIDEQLSSYELSYGGMPTFLYTASVPTAEGTTVYVTLVAQKLPSGEFQVALASVTDDHHLDRTPWMRPVDVVDPDNEHRASLLMELRAQNSRQFALYRLTGPQAEQIFVTGVIE